MRRSPLVRFVVFLYYRMELSLGNIVSYEARRMEKRGEYRGKVCFGREGDWNL